MNRLQLATLLSWAEANRLQGRKRLQKVVFFLQEAGCPLDCRFTLHYFGPYSRDVADACDEMVAAGLVEESGGPSSGDMQYSYSLTPEALQALRALQQAPDARMQEFQEIAAELIETDIWSLELGSTILFFYKQKKDWEKALTEACEFKNVPSDSAPSRNALRLAQRMHAQGTK